MLIVLTILKYLLLILLCQALLWPQELLGSFSVSPEKSFSLFRLFLSFFSSLKNREEKNLSGVTQFFLLIACLKVYEGKM